MDLLDLSISPSGSIIDSKSGDYTRDGSSSSSSSKSKTSSSSSPTHTEFVFARPGGIIDLYSSDSETGVMRLLSSTKTFSIIRSIDNFRMQGSKRDHIVIGTDSGTLSIIKFEDASKNYVATTVQCEVFGKTGVRRPTPGQYVTSDPKGRAILVSAIEKQKLVYVMNRDGAGNPTISSPLEAHKSNTIIFDVKALDVGFENPVFAALEMSYAEADADSTGVAASSASKMLTYYELDLGLNHVTRRWTVPVHRSAHILTPLPGGTDGPSGVLVCGEDYISYFDESQAAVDITCVLPRRANHPSSKGVLITSSVVHRQRKNKFFAIIQTELGDAYKVTVDVANDQVTGLKVQLIDTLPVANALNVTKLGLLFVASEFGDHCLYQLEQSIVELENAVESTSINCTTARGEASPLSFYSTANAESIAPSFTPSPMLLNMRLIDSVASLGATVGLMVGEYAGTESSPQIYTLCGRGPRSSLRVLRHGAAITELAVSDLPGTPSDIFTIVNPNSNNTDADAGADAAEGDKYIVVSFNDATLVLSIGESVEEVSDSNFLTDVRTLACCALSDGGMVQVHPGGVRHIKNKQAKEWQCPGLKRIEHATCNSSQVVIAFAGGEVTYFELDPQSSILNEASSKNLGVEITCIDIGLVPPGRARSFFVAVGCKDDNVRVLSLTPGQLLSNRSSTVVPAEPFSLSIVDMNTDKGTDTYLTIGLLNGMMVQTTLDPTSGALAANPTKRFLGARAVKVTRTSVDGKQCALLLSSRPWVSHVNSSNRNVCTPLSYSALDHCCKFSSPSIPEGIVATAGDTLRILSIDNVDSNFNQTNVPLRYTPRQCCLISSKLAIVESDANDVSEAEKKKAGYGSTDVTADDEVKAKVKDGDMEVDDDEEEEGEDEDEKNAKRTVVRGPIPSSPGSWSSCVRIIDPKTTDTVDVVELADNEAALCCCAVQFHSRGGEVLLAVGSTVEMTMNPVKSKTSYVSLYRIINNRLTLLHKTMVEGIVVAMTQFQGKLLCGVGGSLRLFEMGKKQILRKCELNVKTFVKTLQAAGDRIYVGDISSSIMFVKYDSATNKMQIFAEDAMQPKHIVAQEILDINTVCASDRFGNVYILRSPKNAIEESINLGGGLFDTGRNSGNPKLEVLCTYHVGEIVTSMKRASLIVGGSEAVIYSTVSGKIGAFLPIKTRDDVEFYTTLEQSMRQEPGPVGRDPCQYRSSYAPIKHVVDGDLLEQYTLLSAEKRKGIAEKLERTVQEIEKKVNEMGNELL